MTYIRNKLTDYSIILFLELGINGKSACKIYYVIGFDGKTEILRTRMKT